MSSGKYMAIDPGAILPETLPKFKIYVLMASGKHVLWALDGNKVTKEQLARLSEGGYKDIFLDLEESIKYDEYLEANLGEILDNHSATIDQKATIFSKVSTNVVKTAFKTAFKAKGVSEEVLLRTKKMVENAMKFITESKSLPALARMIGHDYKTYEHAAKVLWFTVAFLKENPEIMEQAQRDEGLDEQPISESLKSCGVCALLHDIGKAYVPPEIINKKGILTEIEWEVMKRHPLYGLAMLLDTDLPVFVKKAILYHHEDFEDGGYPMGLAGMNIPILARVLRITDTFDAMTSQRSYKEALSPMKAAQLMIGKPANDGEKYDSEINDRDKNMGRCFDRDLLRRFIVFIGKVKLG
jgi:HD-GYP domain-containing protein (c-di-GMP phosphodiesterase class II)